MTMRYVCNPLLALGLLLPLPVASGSASLVPEPARIVNGVNSHGFPTTGALMYNSSGGDIDEDNADSWCSGTLIGCSTFLTAAHCIEDDADPDHYWVFLQHAGIRQVVSVTPHPNYTSGGFPEFDIAVVKLATPVTGIQPTAINLVGSPPAGSVGLIAGFGQTSGNGGDYGIKRAGQVVTASCNGLVGGFGDAELVCWSFSNPVGLPGDDSNTCNADSGGHDSSVTDRWLCDDVPDEFQHQYTDTAGARTGDWSGGR